MKLNKKMYTEKNPTMFDDEKDAKVEAGPASNDGSGNEGGKTYKFVDKRKFTGEEGSGSVEETAPDSGSGSGEKIVETESLKEPDEKVAPEPGVNFEADFATFIYSLNTQALLFLGKIPNPMTGKYEKDVNAAKYLIDTIDMLSKKTKGNLNQDESKLIDNILYDLRMAYISEK